MILYRLRCNDDHEFEGWFRNADAFETQRESGLLACPACGTADVTKALMAPSIAKGREVAIAAPAEVQAMHPAAQKAAELKQKLRAVRQMVEQNCDYVGDRFADEARKIHYGETDAHGIYGETTAEESERLKDEGIEFGSVPWIRDDA
ncbi:DUF1178 family protein [Thalassobaculum sp.]|uniref:DUF1178 family protein n=1 Tax=Thalassobaculum sp. TaxID=2022740 RepID=UPI0032EB87DB